MCDRVCRLDFFLFVPQVILKEREERKQRRLLEEKGLPPENEPELANNCTEKEHCDVDTAGQSAQ